MSDQSSDPFEYAIGGNRIRTWVRIVAGVVGGALVISGLRRRSAVGVILALVGGWVLYRVAGGQRGGPRTDSGPWGIDEPTDDSTITGTVTIGRPPDEVAEILRDPDRLGSIVGDVAEVTATGEDRHEWTVSGPAGRSLSWEMELVDDEPDDHLRWESSGGTPVFDSLTASFEPAPKDRGTFVTLEMQIDPPGGRWGSVVMKPLGLIPETATNVALDRLKSLVETGEIPTLEKNPSARGSGDLL